jgi:hypothetical protein
VKNVYVDEEWAVIDTHYREAYVVREPVFRTSWCTRVALVIYRYVLILLQHVSASSESFAPRFETM